MRYFTKKLLSSFIYLIFVFGSLIWLIQSLKYFKFIVDRSAALLGFFALTSLIIPNLLSYIIPFAFCLSMNYVYSQFYQNRELRALETLGWSTYQITKPIYFCAFLATAIQIILQNYIPSAFQAFSAREQMIKNQITVRFLQPNQINVINDNIIFFQNRGIDNSIEHVFIASEKKSGNEYIIAQSAEIERNKNHNILYLSKGLRIEEKDNSILKISFDTLRYDIGEMFQGLEPIQKLIFGSELYPLMKSDDIIARSEAYLRILRVLLPLFSAPILVYLMFYLRGLSESQRLTFAGPIASLLNGCLLFGFKIIKSDRTIFILFSLMTIFWVFFVVREIILSHKAEQISL